MSWITIGEQEVPELEQAIEQRYVKLLENSHPVPSQRFTDKDIAYISKLDRSIIQGELLLSDKHLEQLRTLATLYYVDFKQEQISSHRKFVGPVIVKAKQLMFPILRIFLKKFLVDQRAFNAQVLLCLSELYKNTLSSKKD